ncbi:hypothetical protein AB0N65_09495 [Paenarthrobacter sp. NPDC089322]|uniref:hypothetical protein n=1 Tax=Paenarthrobacter sp. NPDC089322 TaxID=3155065 RepID=UPI00342FF094
MNPGTVSRRSILRLIPAAAAACTVVVMSAEGALARKAAQKAAENRHPAKPADVKGPQATPNHRGIIGLL